MARPRSADRHVPEANIWPAVTDSILLMASIFIVLAVASLVSIVQKIDDQAGAGQDPGEKLVCKTVALSAEFLFNPGRSEFKNTLKAREKLVSQLRELAKDLDGIKRYARQQKDWKQGYYIVLEVSGHTDLDWLASYRRAGADGNWELSGERAVTVAHELEYIFTQSPVLSKAFDVKLGFNGTASSIQARPGSGVLRVAGYGSHLPVVEYPAQDVLAAEWAEYKKIAMESGKPGYIADQIAQAKMSTLQDERKQMNRRVELRLYAQPTYIVKASMSR